jgi:hypothetical protein
MLWEEIKSFLESWFNYSGIAWHLIILALAVALVFGGIWMAFYRQPRSSGAWPLGVMVFSAFFTVVAIAFVQLPLQYWVEEGMLNIWSRLTLNDWLLLAGLPTILIGGFVQEGAKMVPMLAWWHGRRGLDPKMGLVIGAIAGFGFGVFEAFWVNAYVLGSGWDFDVIGQYGFVGIAPFFERFFTVGFHTAASALAGYGLAKGRGWQFFLIAGGAHSLLNYSTLLYQKGHFTITQVEIWIAVVAALATAAAVWLRYRKEEEELLPPPQTIEPAAPAGPTETPIQPA